MSKPFATATLPSPRQEKAKHRAILNDMLKQLEATKAKRLVSPLVSDRVSDEQVMQKIEESIAKCKAGLAFLDQ